MNCFLVIHTEKAGHPQVRKKMLEFGRSLQGKIRPIAAVTTPLSALYEGQDDFADSLKELDRYFSIQYHGHFPFKYIPSTFGAEISLLNKVGFKPNVYAGGWWVMNNLVAEQLERFDFAFDTSMNNKMIDSFGGPQHLPSSHRFVEVPTWRHFRMPSVNVPFCLSFHDYDLVNQGLRNWLWIRRMKSVALKSKVTSFEEL